MISETITKNDLTAILNEVLPPTPSEYKKLLWTNPNPTSAMSTTNIVFSGADSYDAIEVVYKTAYIYNGYETVLSPFVVGSHITLLAPSGTGGEFSGAIYNAVRTISMLSGGALRVDDAIGMTSSGTTANNNMCIPYKVYGIKYERVAPPQVEYPNYSTEEQQVGTWIDGKPIYRKVIPANLTAGINSITAPSNIDTFVTLRGMEKESGGAQTPIPKAHNSTFAYQIGIYYSGGNIYIEVGSNLTNITSAYIICEYTKTTD